MKTGIVIDGISVRIGLISGKIVCRKTGLDEALLIAKKYIERGFNHTRLIECDDGMYQVSVLGKRREKCGPNGRTVSFGKGIPRLTDL